jgi:Asp-tRNA(Asn)/Glu-tRNA(Gln) amidotransferase A subunit family amidase
MDPPTGQNLPEAGKTVQAVTLWIGIGILLGTGWRFRFRDRLNPGERPWQVSRRNVLLTTNLTGHPTAVVPAGFIDGHPMSISFVGGLWPDDAAIGLAAAYQGVTDFHQRVPERFR